MTAAGRGKPKVERVRGEISVGRIAALAGVSAPTVSKVIHGRPGVSSSTRRRIEKLIQEHGYRRPDNPAPTAVVEMVFQALDSLWALEIIRGVEQVVRPHGCAVAVTEMQGRLIPDTAWAQQVFARRPMGVIAVSARLTAAQRTQLASRGIPVVTLDPTGEPLHQTPSVGAMNWNGGLSAARHLLELGHRRIAMINGPDDFLCCRARLDGYRAALDAAGVPADPALVRIGSLYVEGGLAAAQELLSLPDPPTAVFAANDLQALGVYAAARQAGLRIPNDLSVVGFDDLAFTQWSDPPLTTVRQPLLQMGAAAADVILALSAGRTPDHDRIELATTLTIRGSTARPRRTTGRKRTSRPRAPKASPATPDHANPPT
jgi:DNA-binding LacI/PurR family transcriptional regulator